MVESVGIFFFDDWSGRAQPPVGSATLDMRYMTKLGMPVSSTPPWPLFQAPASAFLNGLTVTS